MHVAVSSSSSASKGNSSNQVGFSNDGYWGMDVKMQPYTGSFWVKGAYEGSFTASLQSNLTGEVFGSTKIKAKTSPAEWIEHEFKLTPTKDAPNSNNTFSLTFDAAVSLPRVYSGRRDRLYYDAGD